MIAELSLDQRHKPNELLKRLPSEKFMVAHDFLSYLVGREEKYEQDVPLSAWLKIAEPSFEFWDNEKDAAYDEL